MYQWDPDTIFFQIVARPKNWAKNVEKNGLEILIKKMSFSHSSRFFKPNLTKTKCTMSTKIQPKNEFGDYRSTQCTIYCGKTFFCSHACTYIRETVAKSCPPFRTIHPVCKREAKKRAPAKETAESGG